MYYYHTYGNNYENFFDNYNLNYFIKHLLKGLGHYCIVLQFKIYFDAHAKFIDAFITALVLENRQDVVTQAQWFESLIVKKIQG